MLCAMLLASGTGSRMGNTTMPKQFLMVGKKPIIIHTIEQFLCVKKIDNIIIIVSNEWKNHLDDLLNQYDINNVHVVIGGLTRHDSVINGCKYIKEVLKCDDATIISHDAVRPFITRRIIEDNIKMIENCDVVDTIIPAVDTIVEVSEDLVSNIPDRKMMYQGQTPQTFRLNDFLNICDSLNEEEKAILTDVCKVYYFKNKKIGYVNGEIYNFKITTKYDLNIANSIVKGEIKL